MKKTIKIINNILFVYQAYKISLIPIVILCGMLFKGNEATGSIIEFIYYPWFVLFTEATKSVFVYEYRFVFGILYIFPSVLLLIELLFSEYLWHNNITKKYEKMLLFFFIAGFFTDIIHIIMLFASWF